MSSRSRPSHLARVVRNTHRQQEDLEMSDPLYRYCTVLYCTVLYCIVMSDLLYRPELDDSVIPLDYITTYVLEDRASNEGVRNHREGSY